MKVILLQTIEKLGELGEIVEVSDGYARNFLFPSKMAYLATQEAKAQLETKLAEIKKEEEKAKAELTALAESLGQHTVTIPVQVGEDGKLFGSVTGKDIAEALEELAKTEIERKDIELEEPIKELGEHNVPLNLGRGVHANIKVVVAKKTSEDEKEEVQEAQTEK